MPTGYTPRALETPAERLERRLDKIKKELLKTLVQVETFPHPIPVHCLRIKQAHLPLVDRLVAWLPSQGYKRAEVICPGKKKRIWKP